MDGIAETLLILQVDMARLRRSVPQRSAKPKHHLPGPGSDLADEPGFLPEPTLAVLTLEHTREAEVVSGGRVALLHRGDDMADALFDAHTPHQGDAQSMLEIGISVFP